MNPHSRRLRTVLMWIDRVTSVVAAALLCALVAVTIATVVYRYGVNAPLTWSNEVQESLFVWLTFLGAAVAMARNEHSGFTSLIARFPESGRLAVTALSTLAILAFLGICTWLGLEALPQLMGRTTPTLGLSVALTYAALPVGMLLILIQFLGMVVSDPAHTQRLLDESRGAPV
jgi:TRAP-type C4-dicarboxylate transport system permease small subunit